MMFDCDDFLNYTPSLVCASQMCSQSLPCHKGLAGIKLRVWLISWGWAPRISFILGLNPVKDVGKKTTLKIFLHL